MILPEAQNILSNCGYLVYINCKVTDEYDVNFIPSFKINTPTNYLVKSKKDIEHIIYEIFMVWRYIFHSNKDEDVRRLNKDYMEHIIKQINNISDFSGLKYTFNSGIDLATQCIIKIYSLNNNFINFLDLTYKKQVVETVLDNYYKHHIFSFVIFKDINPNRFEIKIQKDIKLTEIYDIDFYLSHFTNMDIVLKDSEKFTEMIKSNNSFMLSKNDFVSEKDILYSNIYFIAQINESVTTVEQEIYYLKIDYLLNKCKKGDIYKIKSSL